MGPQLDTVVGSEVRREGESDVHSERPTCNAASCYLALQGGCSRGTCAGGLPPWRRHVLVTLVLVAH